MSSQQSSSSTSYSSFSSTSYSSSSTRSNGLPGEEQVSGTRRAQQSFTDAAGNITVRSASQTLGQPIVSEERRYDSQGREMLGAGESERLGGGRRIEDVSEEEQKARDREYEERIEEEYAKREGGA